MCFSTWCWIASKLVCYVSHIIVVGNSWRHHQEPEHNLKTRPQGERDSRKDYISLVGKSLTGLLKPQIDSYLIRDKNTNKVCAIRRKDGKRSNSRSNISQHWPKGRCWIWGAQTRSLDRSWKEGENCVFRCHLDLDFLSYGNLSFLNQILNFSS